jgi:sarcosine oxidase subunit gamma
MLRGDADDASFRTAVERTLGPALPVEPNTTSRSMDTLVLWRGPDEWMVVTPPEGAPSAIAALCEALADGAGAVADVSDAYAVITVTGSRARDLIATGCFLDLHPRVFGPGRCAQSHIAQAQVMIHQLDETPAFDIYVDRSFAEYLWRWLDDAALEFRGPSGP